LSADLLQHPSTERHDQPAAFRQWNELSWRYRSKRGVTPAYQRFSADNAGRGELELRLEFQRQLASLERQGIEPIAAGERRWRRWPGWRSFLHGVGSLSIVPIGTYAASANFHQPFHQPRDTNSTNISSNTVQERPRFQFFSAAD
jgi:hypothetical protein